MKYKITKEDLNKRNYNKSLDRLNEDFLIFIENEKKANNPLLSKTSIHKTESTILKNINLSIYIFCAFGLLSLCFGLYLFIKIKPSLAVNLYTQFPYIQNGSLPIVLGLASIIGCILSYVKRDSILITKVKSKIIEQLRIEQQDKYLENSYNVSKKRRRFRQKFTSHKKRV